MRKWTKNRLPTTTLTSCSINCLDFSDDLLLVAAGTSQSYIRLWHMEGKPLVSVLPQSAGSRLHPPSSLLAIQPQSLQSRFRLLLALQKRLMRLLPLLRQSNSPLVRVTNQADFGPSKLSLVSLCSKDTTLLFGMSSGARSVTTLLPVVSIRRRAFGAKI